MNVVFVMMAGLLTMDSVRQIVIMQTVVSVVNQINVVFVIKGLNW